MKKIILLNIMFIFVVIVSFTIQYLTFHLSQIREEIVMCTKDTNKEFYCFQTLYNDTIILLYYYIFLTVIPRKKDRI
jgi:hypothetical protein